MFFVSSTLLLVSENKILHSAISRELIRRHRFPKCISFTSSLAENRPYVGYKKGKFDLCVAILCGHSFQNIMICEHREICGILRLEY